MIDNMTVQKSVYDWGTRYAALYINLIIHSVFCGISLEIVIMESKLSSLSTTQPNSAALSSPSFEFSSCNDPELALRTASPDVSMTTPGGGWWGDAPAQDRENGNDNDGFDGTSRSSTQSGNSNPKVKSTQEEIDILLGEDVHVVVDNGVNGTSSSVHFYLPTTIERTFLTISRSHVDYSLFFWFCA